MINNRPRSDYSRHGCPSTHAVNDVSVSVFRLKIFRLSARLRIKFASGIGGL